MIVRKYSRVKDLSPVSNDCTLLTICPVTQFKVGSGVCEKDCPYFVKSDPEKREVTCLEGRV